MAISAEQLASLLLSYDRLPARPGGSSEDMALHKAQWILDALSALRDQLDLTALAREAIGIGDNSPGDMDEHGRLVRRLEYEFDVEPIVTRVTSALAAAYQAGLLAARLTSD